MRSLLSILLLVAAFSTLRADTSNLPPAGIIILKPVAGYDAAASWFVSIQWVNKDGGYIVDTAGNKMPFLNEAIGRIIYFDEAYYDEVDHNEYWVDWRAGLQSHEVVMPAIPATGLRPEDSPRLASELSILQDAIGRYPSGQALVTPLIDTLNDEISKLGSGLVLQNGSWIEAKNAVTVQETVPVIGDSESPVTFTTKDGKRFENVKVTVTDTGLSVLTADGGASVAFDQLPKNLAAFPKTAQDKIADWRTKHPVIVAAPPPPPPAPPPPRTWIAWIEACYHTAVTKTWAFFSPAPSAGAATTDSASAPSASSASAPGAPVASTTPPAVTASSVPDLSNTIVLIKGDYAEGTGFLTRTSAGPVVITNLHVIAGNPNLKIMTSSGQEIVPLSLQGATDRDLAMFSIQDNNYKYLELAANVDQTAAVGDSTIIPGDSEGGEVTLKTDGSLVGIGPQRVEFNNPIFHGNSGGPVLDVKTGKVVAVATGATEMHPTDDLDRNSFSNANSAIKGPMRYFGLRIDTVPSWQPYDQQGFVHETLFLKRFHDESRALDSYLNGSKSGVREDADEGPPDPKYYLTNDKIRKADDDWHTATQEGRSSAVQELVWNLGAVAGADLGSVQDFSTFYPYDQDRAKFELKYRQALMTEIQNIQTQVNKPETTSTVSPGL